MILRQCPDEKFPERGCARSVSRRTAKLLRLVFDTAALRQIRIQSILIAAHGESGFHPACFDCGHFAITGCRC